MTLNSILNIGSKALMNAQVGISVTSDNMANADVEGYSRKTVSYESSLTMNSYGLTLGTGADVQEIVRNFNTYLESQYLDAISEESYWYTQADTLYNVETLFAESDEYGISTIMDDFFVSLDALAQGTDDEAQRDELTSYAQILADTLQSLKDSLQGEIDTLNDEIGDTVTEINTLADDIAELNKALAANPESSELQDARTVKLRALAGLVDIQTIDQDNGMTTVLLAGGQTLVDGTETYSLAYERAQAFSDLDADSAFDGQIYFDGEYSQEFQIEMVGEGLTDGTASAATFKVSLDGGTTWLMDDDGEVMLFTAGGYDDRVSIEGVDIWFGSTDDPYEAVTTELSEDDRFTVMAKSGVYWYETTSNKVNITPLADTAASGDTRVSGGSLGGLLVTRDQSVSTYLEEMDALAEELIWQVNYQHSQGAGLDHYSSTYGVHAAEDTTSAMADSGLEFADRLTAGSLSFALYDEESGDSLGVTAIDFSAIDPPGLANFDPEQHSLQDVATAINDSLGGQVTATVSDGRLYLTAAEGVEFEFAGDTTGLLAATGINTFFSGDSLEDIAVDSRVLADSNRVNCAVVDGTGMVEEGDNTNILALADLADTNVTLDTYHSTSNQSLTSHLHTVVAEVGSDMDSAARYQTIAETLSTDLQTSQESVSGVNMDEELTLLARYQQAYETAAQLIQTANEMFDIVMALKS